MKYLLIGALLLSACHEEVTVFEAVTTTIAPEAAIAVGVMSLMNGSPTQATANQLNSSSCTRKCDPAYSAASRFRQVPRTLERWRVVCVESCWNGYGGKYETYLDCLLKATSLADHDYCNM